MEAHRRQPRGVASFASPGKCRSRRRTLSTLAVATAVVSALFAAGSARGQEPSTLFREEVHQFRTFFDPTVFQVSGVCNPTGTSTLSFTVTGADASGPYTGHMDGSGTATFGPQILPPQTQSGFPFTAVGEITQFDESFTLTAGDTTISGTKHLGEIPDNPISEGACAVGPNETTWYFFANTAYDALITTPAGQFRDSGLSYAEMQPIFDGQNNIVAAGFSEFFVLSNGLVPVTTPGQATGTGLIDYLGGRLRFAFTASSTDDGTMSGSCSVAGRAIHIRCDDVTQYFQSGNHAIFSGTAEVSGSPAAYRIEVQDNADPGAGADTFSITTSTGFSASGVLTQGDIQVHQ
jgi:hypothetical protein